MKNLCFARGFKQTKEKFCMKNILMTLALISGGGSVHAETEATAGVSKPVLLEAVRYNDGRIMTMTQSQAFAYCASIGAHLPTAREFAQYTMTLGAKGIAEINARKSDGNLVGRPDNSYEGIVYRNLDGTRDAFYYSMSGYQAPEGDLGKQGFWTSSVSHQVLPDYPYAYVLFGNYGALGESNRGYGFDYAVRCVSGK
jgi:hypothetical protein